MAALYRKVFCKNPPPLNRGISSIFKGVLTSKTICTGFSLLNKNVRPNFQYFMGGSYNFNLGRVLTTNSMIQKKIIEKLPRRFLHSHLLLQARKTRNYEIVFKKKEL